MTELFPLDIVTEEVFEDIAEWARVLIRFEMQRYYTRRGDGLARHPSKLLGPVVASWKRGITGGCIHRKGSAVFVICSLRLA